MRIEPIAPAYKYFCDSCGVAHTQANALGHYTHSTPPGWMSFRVIKVNVKGDTVRNVEALVCNVCAEKAKKTLFNNYQDFVSELIFGKGTREREKTSKS